MIVLKFGGTSVGSAGAIREVGSIVEAARSRRPVVVVSALSGVTDKLIAAARAATAGDRPGGDDHLAHADMLRERHARVAADLSLPEDLVAGELDELSQLLDSVFKLGELTARTLDRVMSLGERASSKVVAAHLSARGMPARAFAAYDLGLRTDSAFGNAEPVATSLREVRRSLADLDPTIVPVVTGFIARSVEGSVTTLGRGGSDYTAALVGTAVGAEEIQIWTNVNGVMSADPRICPEARTLSTISFAEVSELAYFGAKVLHPKSIRSAVDEGIPVLVKNTHDPAHPGTTIVPEPARGGATVKAITLKREVTLFNIVSTRMLFAHGFLARVFALFERQRVSVDMVCTSEVSVTVSVDDVQLAAEADLAAIRQDLDQIARTEIIQGKSLVCVVGDGIKEDTRSISDIFDILAENGIAVEMISVGASRINVSFVVSEPEAERAVRLLHRRLVEEKSAPIGHPARALARAGGGHSAGTS